LARLVDHIARIANWNRIAWIIRTRAKITWTNQLRLLN
jgi:hypothetical protein